jgi:DNA-binding response OmpR family regulator
MKILVCDDDHAITDAIEIYLKQEGYEVAKAYNGLEALAALKDNDIQLILLDIMMPELDGLRATLKIREHSNIPIIILSAKTEDTDKILGLNMGADDYIAKPFNPLELLARVKSQLRRYTSLGASPEKPSIFRSGGLVLDDEAKEVTADGDPIKLTRYEYNIVRLLLTNAGKVYASDQIYEQVWSEPAINTENTVAVHIRRIREKIEINPKDPKYLKVVWGIGYKIEKLD